MDGARLARNLSKIKLSNILLQFGFAPPPPPFQNLENLQMEPKFFLHATLEPGMPSGITAKLVAENIIESVIARKIITTSWLARKYRTAC